MYSNSEKYDLTVIGGGSGGVRAARLSAEYGAKVALIEESAMGGTCVNRGCIPKKLFLFSSEYRAMSEEAKAYGWDFKLNRADWGGFVQRKDEEIRRLNGIYNANLQKAGVEVFSGTGKIAEPGCVEVNGERLKTDRTLISVGGKPFLPNLEGIEHAITSNEIFDLKVLPEKLLIVGGGYIAVEFASIFNRLGCDTTLSYRGGLFLKAFDQDVRAFLRDEMTKSGLRLLFDSQVAKLEKVGGKVVASFEDGGRETFDCVVYCTGRKPKLDRLGLENTNVKLSRGGKILTDAKFQTDEPNVYALGDVSSPKELTPVAIYEAALLSRNLFCGESNEMNYDNIPTAVFSHPNIGSVGLTEHEALEQCANVKARSATFSPMRKAFAEINQKTFMKVIVDQSNDRVVGMHMVGDDAAEIIQGFAVAIQSGMTYADLRRTVAVHPSTAEEFVLI